MWKRKAGKEAKKKEREERRRRRKKKVPKATELGSGAAGI